MANNRRCKGEGQMGVTIHMDTIQKRIVYVAVAVVVLMGVFPPWHITYGLAIGSTATRIEHLGYSLLCNPPFIHDFGGEISFGLLFLQWLLVVILTAGLVCIVKDRREVFSH
jgi:hypothetical protein